MVGEGLVRQDGSGGLRPYEVATRRQVVVEASRFLSLLRTTALPTRLLIAKATKRSWQPGRGIHETAMGPDRAALRDRSRAKWVRRRLLHVTLPSGAAP